MGSVQLGFEGFSQLINIHPVFVHFPIALLASAALFYLLGVLFKKDSLLQAGRWALYAGTLSAGLAIWTGLRAERTVEHDAVVHEIIELHEKLAYVVAGLAVSLSAWTLAVKAAIPSKGKVVFIAALILLVVLIGQQADLGGRMVFLHGAGVGKSH